MNRAYYIDTYSYGSLHEMYNASSLLMFSYIFDNILYAADISSKRQVENILVKIPENIKYQKIYVPKGKNKLWAFIKQIFALINNCYYIILADKNDTVIINYNTMSNIFVINYIAKKINKKVLIVCHGEMVTLTENIKTSKIFSISKTFFTKENVKIAPKLYFAVLGDIILENLKPYLSNNVYKKFITFDHSAIFRDKNDNKNFYRDKLKFGVLGIRANKGLNNLINLSNRLKPLKEKVQISIIGKVEGNYDIITNSGIYITKESISNFLTRKEMNKKISEVDFILFMYPNNGYKVTASGALFDAIDCEIPILAIKNDYFEYIFKKYSCFGCLVNNFEEMEAEIKELIDGKKYDIDFSKIKQLITPKSIAQELKKKLYNKLIIKK